MVYTIICILIGDFGILWLRTSPKRDEIGPFKLCKNNKNLKIVRKSKKLHQYSGTYLIRYKVGRRIRK